MRVKYSRTYKRRPPSPAKGPPTPTGAPNPVRAHTSARRARSDKMPPMDGVAVCAVAAYLLLTWISGERSQNGEATHMWAGEAWRSGVGIGCCPNKPSHPLGALASSPFAICTYGL